MHEATAAPDYKRHVQARRDKRAATKFFRRLLTGLPYVLIPGTLASYGAARGLAERGAPSASAIEQPGRELAPAGPRAGATHAAVHSTGACATRPRRPRRHRLTAAAYRQTRDECFATWRAVTGMPAMA